MNTFLPRSEGLDHAEGAPTRFMVASSGVLSGGYGHGGSAWAMSRRRPKEYRRKVDAGTRCFGACPHTLPYLNLQKKIANCKKYTLRSKIESPTLFRRSTLPMGCKKMRSALSCECRHKHSGFESIVHRNNDKLYCCTRAQV